MDLAPCLAVPEVCAQDPPPIDVAITPSQQLLLLGDHLPVHQLHIIAQEEQTLGLLHTFCEYC